MNDVAIDACCLINLLAAQTILPAPSLSPRGGNPLNLSLHVPGVVARESVYLLGPDDGEGQLVKSPIDLAPYFARGILFACDVDEGKETERFVRYATLLDDGEAACLAIAESRRWLLATDDRPATRLAGQAGVLVLTTAELVKRWALKQRAAKRHVAAALRNIERFAKFTPRRNSPEAAWWSSHIRDK